MSGKTEWIDQVRDSQTEWLRQDIEVHIEHNGWCLVTSELLNLIFGVRVVADTADGKMGLVRQYPGVFLDLVINREVAFDGPVVARFSGDLKSLQAFCTRNGWVCYPESGQNATAKFIKA